MRIGPSAVWPALRPALIALLAASLCVTLMDAPAQASPTGPAARGLVSDLNLAAEVGGAYVGAVQYDGSFQGRTFRLFVPDRAPTAVVLGLHGLGVDSGTTEDNLDLQLQAAAKGWLMLFPDSPGNSWNAGQCCGPSQQEGLDDVDYLAGLVTAVQDDFHPAATVPTVGIGFSNGGMMLEEMACRIPGMFAGLLLDKANLEDPNCISTPVREIVQIRSQNDITVPIGDPSLRSLRNVYTSYTGTYGLPDTYTIRAFATGGILSKPASTEPAQLIQVQKFVVNRGSLNQRTLTRVLEERSVLVRHGKRVQIVHGQSAHRFDTTSGLGYVSDSAYAAQVIDDAVAHAQAT